ARLPADRGADWAAGRGIERGGDVGGHRGRSCVGRRVARPSLCLRIGDNTAAEWGRGRRAPAPDRWRAAGAATRSRSDATRRARRRRRDHRTLGRAVACGRGAAMNPSTAMARVLLDELCRGGVRDVVLAPGSRNSPLAFALHDADRAERLRLHVRIDERSAAFLALGLAKAGRRPVPVVCTSGTAAANLHPAVLEAHHSGVPLIVLTADRPAELRDTGANQTTDQVKLYGGAVRFFADVAAAERRPGQNAYWRGIVARAVACSRGIRDRNPGPVHLNLAFREPLVPDLSGDWPESLVGRPNGARWTRIDRITTERFTYLPAGPRTVVIAGDGTDPQARWLAETAGWPLLAEPSSGARSGPNALG